MDTETGPVVEYNPHRSRDLLIWSFFHEIVHCLFNPFILSASRELLEWLVELTTSGLLTLFMFEQNSQRALREAHEWGMQAEDMPASLVVKEAFTEMCIDVAIRFIMLFRAAEAYQGISRQVENPEVSLQSGPTFGIPQGVIPWMT